MCYLGQVSAAAAELVSEGAIIFDGEKASLTRATDSVKEQVRFVLNPLCLCAFAAHDCPSPLCVCLNDTPLRFPGR